MSLATIVPAAVLETILSHLAMLFLTAAAGDNAAARDAASHMLGAYHPETEDELRLAAKIVGCSFQAIQALGQAATPDMPLTRVFRLRSGAVSLSRTSEKAERRLEQLQKARRQGVPAQPAETQPEPVQAEPAIEKAVVLIEDTRKIAALAKSSGTTWSQSYEKHRQDLRIAASLKRAEARIAALANAAATVPPPGVAQSALSAA
jgi:hypothetical protein